MRFLENDESFIALNLSAPWKSRSGNCSGACRLTSQARTMNCVQVNGNGSAGAIDRHGMKMVETLRGAVFDERDRVGAVASCTGLLGLRWFALEWRAWKKSPFLRQHGRSDGRIAELSGKVVSRRAPNARSTAEDRLRFMVMGDKLSALPGWQEEAFLFAEHVLNICH